MPKQWMPYCSSFAKNPLMLLWQKPRNLICNTDLFLYVVWTGLDSSSDSRCYAQPASQTILHVHVYPGSGPVHPHSALHCYTRRWRRGNSQTTLGVQHHQAACGWLHHPSIWSHSPHILLHVARSQWHAHWVSTSELIAHPSPELRGSTLSYTLCGVPHNQFGFLRIYLIFQCRWSLRFTISSLRRAPQSRFTCP